MTIFSIITGSIILLAVFYIFFQMIQTRSLEKLLENKQKEKVVELRRTSLRPQYSIVSILVLTLFVVIGTGIKSPVDPEPSRIMNVLSEDLPSQISESNNGIFIVNVSFNIEILEYAETTTGQQFIDPDLVSVVEGVVVEDAKLDKHSNVLQVTHSDNMRYNMYTEMEEVPDEAVYLVIGGVVLEDDQEHFQSEFVTVDNMLYPWTVYLIEDYNPNKSYKEQEQSVKDLIMEIISRYYE